MHGLEDAQTQKKRRHGPPANSFRRVKAPKIMSSTNATIHQMHNITTAIAIKAHAVNILWILKLMDVDNRQVRKGEKEGGVREEQLGSKGGALWAMELIVPAMR